jgi:hypothetical protein
MKRNIIHNSMKEFESIYAENGAEDYLSQGTVKGFISLESLIHDRNIQPEPVSETDLLAVQRNFYELMKYRCRNAKAVLKWLEDHEAELPKITNELFNETEPQWEPVPGMYGGFNYALFIKNGNPVLITDSWIRVVGGSGERHEITPNSVTLTLKGFA